MRGNEASTLAASPEIGTQPSDKPGVPQAVDLPMGTFTNGVQVDSRAVTLDFMAETAQAKSFQPRSALFRLGWREDGSASSPHGGPGVAGAGKEQSPFPGLLPRQA